MPEASKDRSLGTFGEDMSETPNHEIKLNDLMFLALDHAVDSVRETADLLIPFIMTEKDGDKRILTRMALR